MTIPDHKHRKQALRRAIRRLARDAPRDSAAVVRTLALRLAELPGLRTIAVFSALPDEVDLSGLASACPDRCWVYPKVTGHHLTFHAVENPASGLVAGAFGILEPPPGIAEVAVTDIDAFFCPGLAFDRHGGRLGRGRGFYDRLLAMARSDALKIGVCFPWQIVDDTFPETHDIPMDEVVS